MKNQITSCFAALFAFLSVTRAEDLTKIERVKNHIDSLQKYAVTYKSETTKPEPSKELVELIEREFPGTSIAREAPRERFSNILRINEMMFHSEVRPLVPSDSSGTLQINCNTGTRLDSLAIDVRNRARGTIEDAPALRESHLVEIGLGVRMHNRGETLALLRENAFEVSANSKDRNTFTLIASENGKRHSWLFLDSLRLRLVQYQVFIGGERLFDMTCDDFRPENGRLLPYKMIARNFHPQHGEIRVEEIAIDSWNFDNANISPESFFVLFPEGATIRDLRTGLVATVSADKELSDELLFDAKASETAHLGSRTQTHGVANRTLLIISLMLLPLLIWQVRREK